MCTAHGIGGLLVDPEVFGSSQSQVDLGFEDDVLGMGLFYLGYPEGDWPSKGHRKPLEYVTRWTNT